MKTTIHFSQRVSATAPFQAHFFGSQSSTMQCSLTQTISIVLMIVPVVARHSGPNQYFARENASHNIVSIPVFCLRADGLYLLARDHQSIHRWFVKWCGSEAAQKEAIGNLQRRGEPKSRLNTKANSDYK